VLQGKSTKQKYDASLESCANTISLFVSKEHKQQTLYDFFKLTVLNILLRNGDAHLKNYGVLYQELQGYNQGTMPKATIKFSPVFDIVSTTPYLPNDTMALSLTGSKRWPKQEVLMSGQS
jgi:serine/threonine-protein kinase HipA